VDVLVIGACLEAGPSLILDEFEGTLHGREFMTTTGGRHEGWLAYDAVFIAALTGALYQCGTARRRPVRPHVDRSPRPTGHECCDHRSASSICWARPEFAG